MFSRQLIVRSRDASALLGTLRQSACHSPYTAASSSLKLQRRGFYPSKSAWNDQQKSPNFSQNEIATEGPKTKRASRSPAAKTSLRRAAVEAQRSKDDRRKRQTPEEGLPKSKTVTAYAVSERFDIAKVMEILLSKGYEPDPLETGLYPQVVHVQVPLDSIRRTASLASSDLPADEVGDIFIFPSGTVVSWSLPENFASYLASTVLAPATLGSVVDDIETEHLDYVEDSQRDTSTMRGDTIILGTKPNFDSLDSKSTNRDTVDTVLTKIAFSSGLARSTKLAILETLLSDYFDSTRNIPTLLSKGTRLPYTRGFILRKTGQLLNIRAQLNLYSELTDSLPDIFWDSRHELGLEGNYDQVGRALDVGIRIKILNEKMDYAQEIASVLRERLSEAHGLRLEWTIILLIAVEVGFEILRLWKERKHEGAEQKKLEAAST